MTQNDIADELLRKVMTMEGGDSSNRGKLKIFFGYAAGVGKTYAMLQAAHVLKDQGIDVVVGYVEPHGRQETEALLEGLEQIPFRNVGYGNIVLREFDLDAALERHPEVILIDELAHTNAKGCRHSKRYQDIEEVLKAGINVYTTVNVQHIESLNDQVASLTGVTVRERIPDGIFDSADQVELVDIEPDELIARLEEGKVYRNIQKDNALSNFFVLENLVALREIALRRSADRVNRKSAEQGLEHHSGYTNEHVLVCLSSSPSNAKIIRNASRLALAFNANFTALYVESQPRDQLRANDNSRLEKNMRLAKQLGAAIDIAYGQNVAETISNYAKQFRVTKVVLGRSGNRGIPGIRPNLVDKLSQEASNLDIYVIPDTNMTKARSFKWLLRSFHISKSEHFWRDIAITIVTTAVSTLLCLLLYGQGITEVNIVTFYIFGILVNAMFTDGVGFSFISSLLSVLAFNFFFTVPRFTLHAYGVQYPLTFLVMFLSGFFTSTLAKKLRKQTRESMNTAYRMTLLFDMNKLLQKCDHEDEIIEVTVDQIRKLLGKDIVYYPAENGKLMSPRVYASSHENEMKLTGEKEESAAQWVYMNNAMAGATTDTLSACNCLYYSVRVSNRVYGVIGIEMMDGISIVGLERNLTITILGECAQALEKLRITREREEVRTIAKNEQMKTNILRSISHDLRTPLASISGNADLLLHDNGSMTDENRDKLAMLIRDDSIYLINLVENLLSVSRIENGSMALRLNPEIVDEVIDEAVSHVRRYDCTYSIDVVHNDDIIMADMDVRLIVQVLINLIDNGIKYSGGDAKIVISSEARDGKVYISVADNGIGISNENKNRIFEMFYTATNKVSDSRRSMGLGLALCKSIISAHGGDIQVTDNNPTGSVFTFSLNAKEINIDE